MAIKYVHMQKSDCDYCGSKGILHEYGFSYENGKKLAWKKCIKCDIDVLLKDKD